MNIIITKNNKPIYSTNDTTIDFWGVFRVLEPDATVDEWMQTQTFNTLSTQQVILKHNLYIWTFNRVLGDWNLSSDWEYSSDESSKFEVLIDTVNDGNEKFIAIAESHHKQSIAISDLTECLNNLLSSYRVICKKVNRADYQQRLIDYCSDILNKHNQTKNNAK